MTCRRLGSLGRLSVLILDWKFRALEFTNIRKVMDVGRSITERWRLCWFLGGEGGIYLRIVDMNHSRPSGSGSLVLSLSGKSHLVLVANDSSQTFTYVNLFPHRFPHDEETVQQVKSPSLTTSPWVKVRTKVEVSQDSQFSFRCDIFPCSMNIVHWLMSER